MRRRTLKYMRQAFIPSEEEKAWKLNAKIQFPDSSKEVQNNCLANNHNVILPI
jgi:hypothetical protein